MTDHAMTPRLFANDAAIVRIGEGLLDHSLPKQDWTHEAHLAACLWLLRDRPDIVPERDLPLIIRSFNEAKGGVNDDRQGYHETLTQLYIQGVRAFMADVSPEIGLTAAVNALLQSDKGRRDWPLTIYRRETLFSVTARREWVAPDLV